VPSLYEEEDRKRENIYSKDRAGKRRESLF
jgi:hypothetical protein